ncbi:MAG: caspase family protein [Gammaproteobacteria bacterium]|nr:caspase family protein [Gammaproteobacteria bacterium]
MKKILILLISSFVFSEFTLADTRGLTRTHVTPFNSGTYRALVIGNNEYMDKQGLWQSLKTAKQDAVTVANILEKNYGFSDVTLLHDASRRDIILELNNLARRTNPEDSVLVYYAGHGYLDEETNRGYWIPSDATGDDITTYIRNSAIRDEILLISEKAQHTLLVSDSCFSGALLRGGNRGGAKHGVSSASYYEKSANKKSVQIFAAGGMEFVDDNYRSSGHSPFTYFLLSELENNKSALITLTELSTNVAKAVANNVQQSPEIGVLYGAGDELGEFIFAKVTVETEEGIAEYAVQAQKLSDERFNKKAKRARELVLPSLRL